MAQYAHAPLHARFLFAVHVNTELGYQNLTTPADYEDFVVQSGIAESAKKDAFGLSIKYERATDGRCTSAVLTCICASKTSRHKCGQAVLRIHSNGTVSSLLTTDERVLLHERHIEDAHGRTGMSPHFADMAKRYGLIPTSDIQDHDDGRRKRSRDDAASSSLSVGGPSDLGEIDIR